jgi:hypothetical protein
VIESLEAAIAIKQNEIILLAIAADAIKDQEVSQQEGEGKAEFLNRQAKFENTKKNLPTDIADRIIRLRALMESYSKFLKGNSVLGEMTGPIEKVEPLKGGCCEGNLSPA